MVRSKRFETFHCNIIGRIEFLLTNLDHGIHLWRKCCYLFFLYVYACPMLLYEGVTVIWRQLLGSEYFYVFKLYHKADSETMFRFLFEFSFPIAHLQHQMLNFVFICIRHCLLKQEFRIILKSFVYKFWTVYNCLFPIGYLK